MYAKLPFQTLPSSGQLANGLWVSNYNLLPDDMLLAEGWLPLEEVRPVLTDGQYYQLDSAIEENGKIVATYIAIDIPAPAVDPIVEESIQQMEAIVI